MKALRLFIMITLAILVVSALGPAPVYAKQVDVDTTLTLPVDLAKTKLARLRVNNKTGGTLYVNFSGDRSYSFATSKQGKTTFESIIQPGKYTITVTTSSCSGQLNFKRKVKGGTVSLPGFRCRG